MPHRRAATLAAISVLFLSGCGGDRGPAARPTRPPASSGAASLEPTLRAPACLGVAPGCSSGILLAGPDLAGPELNAPNTLGDTCPEPQYDRPSIASIEVATLDGAAMAQWDPVEVQVRASGSGPAFVQLWTAADALAPEWEPLGSAFVDLGAGHQDWLVFAAFRALPPGPLQAVRASIGPAGATGCEATADTDDLAFAVGGPRSRYSLFESPTDAAVVTGDVPLEVALGAGFTHVDYVVEETWLVSEEPPSFRAVWPSAARSEAGPVTVQAWASGPDGQYAYGEVPVTVAASASCDDQRGAPACDTPSSACGSAREAQGAGLAEACGPYVESWLGCPEPGAGGAEPTIEHIVVRTRDGGPLGPDVAARVDVELGGALESDPYGRPLALDVYLLDGDAPGPWTLIGTFDPSYGTRDIPLRVAAMSPTSSDPLAPRWVRAVLRRGGWLGACDEAVLDDDVLGFAATDTTPPLVAMSFPADGGAIASPLWIAATARDAGGVGCVTFLADDAPVGWSCGAPYQVPAELPPGAHRLSAVAVDRSGNSASSAPILVTVDAAPPSIALLTPEPYDLVHGVADVAFAVSDDLGVASVELQVDGAIVGFVEVPPWTYPWDTTRVPPGPHVLQAIATDRAGRWSATREVPVRVDQLPVVQLTAPLDGAQAWEPATFAALASDDGRVAGVEFLVDGSAVATLAEPPWETVWAPDAPGTHRVAARACDDAGQCTTTPEARITFDRIVPLDLAAPVVAVVSPAPGATLAGPVLLEATASDDVGVAGVSFYAGGHLVAQDDAAPWAVPWDPAPWEGGQVTLVAKAWDAAGHVGESAPVAVNVRDVTAPSIAIAAPAPGDVLARDVELKVTATDRVGVVRVAYFLDGVLIGAESKPPFDLAWDVRKVSRGAHVVSASAWDRAGNAGSAAGVSVVVR